MSTIHGDNKWVFVGSSWGGQSYKDTVGQKIVKGEVKGGGEPGHG